LSCTTPIDCFYGKVNENGQRPIVFNRREADWDKKYGPVELQVPCGKCAGCKLSRSLAWSVRCYHESLIHDRNSFITLTYEDKYLPEDGKLKKEEFKEFLDEIRGHKKLIKYYGCGEYGGVTGRPHYHAVIFGTDFRGGNEYSVNDQYYGNKAIEKVWVKGAITIADFNMATACYVAGYVGKKAGTEEDDSFQIMTGKPGIGFQWLKDNYKDVLATNSCVIEGREYPVPPRS